MIWERKQLRRNGFRSAFGQGFRPWFLVVTVCFIFAFIRSEDSGAVSFLGSLDDGLQLGGVGINPEQTQDNIELLKECLAQAHIEQKIPSFWYQIEAQVVNSLSNSYTWIVNLLAANVAYFRRNAHEVAVFMILAAVFSGLFRIFVQEVALIGKKRYMMENRFRELTPLNRILAPFSKRNYLHLFWIMLVRYVKQILWSATIIGGFYKYYEYSMIPYILAENPSLSRKEVFQLSKDMTEGYKWKMFLLQLSVWYIYVLNGVPGLGLLFCAPYHAAINVEIYFLLRAFALENQVDGASAFCERAFEEKVYWELTEEERKLQKGSVPNYLLQGFTIRGLHVQGQPVQEPVEMTETDRRHHLNPGRTYGLENMILLFFTFAMVGWAWEVGLHLVQTHHLVNRGMMYGPWIPIYGVGAVLCVSFLRRFYKDFYTTFGMVILSSGILEFFTSWFLDFVLNVHYWDYHGKFANLNGRVCFTGLLLFGLGGTFAIYVGAPYLSYYYDRIEKRTKHILCMLLCAAFIADLMLGLQYGFNAGKGIGGSY